MINYCAGLPTKACGCSSALALPHSNPHFSGEYYSQIVSFRIILYLSVQYGLTTTHSHERKLCKPTSAPVHLPALTTPDRTDFQYWFFFFLSLMKVCVKPCCIEGSGNFARTSSYLLSETPHENVLCHMTFLAECWVGYILQKDISCKQDLAILEGISCCWSDCFEHHWPCCRFLF